MKGITRQEIIEACLFLQEKELIARTWGNVSARVNSEEFLITPSGLAYELTKPEDLTIVKIADCSYDKTQRKPSSEKLVHAAAYQLRKDVNFIVHTHQFYASAICGEEETTKLADGRIIPCAKYGYPSTKGLQDNCAEAFKEYSENDSFLMAKHGAITFGKTMKEALDSAEKLEQDCQEVFKARVDKFYVPENMKPYLDDYAQMFPLKTNEDEEAIKMVKEKNAAAFLYARKAKPINPIDHLIQHLVYRLKYSKLRNK